MKIYPVYWNMINLLSLIFIIFFYFFQQISYLMFWGLIFVISIIGYDTATLRQEYEKDHKRTGKS